MLDITPFELVARIFILLTGFAIHEMAHAWTADQLGDDTPRLMGRLTLNPLAHLDIFGSLIFILRGFGWAKPVPVNPYRLRPTPNVGLALVAVAGPFSNLVMALLAAIPFRLGLLEVYDIVDPGNGVGPVLAALLGEVIWLNIILMLFNLIPIPPLDGSKILRGMAPPEWERPLAHLEQYGPFLLMIVFFVGGSIVSRIIGPPANFLFSSILGL